MYIDGVFSGGGIKGLALIGAYQALEERGFHIRRAAGTSAGSIIAAFIIAGYTGEEMAALMDEVDLKIFLDQRKAKILPNPLAKWIRLYWKMGLYKGAALEKWLSVKLLNKGIQTFGDIPAGSLRLIASDLTNGKMLVLPDDLQKYGCIPETFPVAKAIRMSCSLPYFFEPVKLKTQTGQKIIVDGGVLSNFPLWLFDNEITLKTRPVIGIKLSANDQDKPPKNIKTAVDLYGALFETMKDAHDARYISRKHVKNIVFVPVESGITTEFTLTDEKKRNLITLGKQRTEKFLRTWTY